MPESALLKEKTHVWLNREPGVHHPKYFGDPNIMIRDVIGGRLKADYDVSDTGNMEYIRLAQAVASRKAGKASPWPRAMPVVVGSNKRTRVDSDDGTCISLQILEC